VLVELDLARDRAAGSLAQTLRATVRNTIVHPVVLPVLAGLAWNITGAPLPGVLDEVLRLLASAVAPVCLVLIGASLAGYGIGAHLRGALQLGALKLFVLPALVLGVAYLGFGVRGQPLGVLALMASLPVGANALVFAQRYATLQAEATTAIVVSTCAFALTAPAWLTLAARLGG
jgi:predicted permease